MPETQVLDQLDAPKVVLIGSDGYVDDVKSGCRMSSFI